MNLPFQPTFNAILMLLIGFGMIAFGVLLAFSPGHRVFAGGLFFTGTGTILFGATNGFTDMTPIGQKLYRLALLAFALGIPLIGYFLYGLL